MGTSESIEAVRKAMGKRLLIVGHHYQRPAVLRHADAIGDSLELARRAARETAAERIVFCGVHFMAETADMLTRPGQNVYMPDRRAGCPMADMAADDDVLRAWERLGGAGGNWLPVVYVNSTAAVKALCGRWGGSACTSSNARKVFEWVFGQGKRVFFLPDEHLGTNTAHDMGIPDDQVVVYDPRTDAGALDSARLVVWRGHCHVHTAFTVQHVEAVRARHPGARIIVHPEAPKEVVRAADAHGSTSQIVNFVRDAPDRSMIVIGTELRLVERLADEYAGRRTIKALAPSICPNMARTTEENLLALLRDWPEQNVVRVRPEVAADARRCVETMLRIS